MKADAINLPELAYDYDALEPAISKEIMKLHHDKHHRSYVQNAKSAREELDEGRKEGGITNLKRVLRDLSFNLNGHILHSVFWQNMRPYSEKNAPSNEMKDFLDKTFGTFGRFKEEFSSAASNVEGSGWLALLKDDDQNVEIMQIENHNKLYLTGFKPILVIDVWEHAYYLDYQNDRARYIEQWWNVVNWDDVSEKAFK